MCSLTYVTVHNYSLQHQPLLPLPDHAFPLPVCLLSPSHDLTRLVDGRELGDLSFLHVLGPNLPLVVVTLGAHC